MSVLFIFGKLKSDWTGILSSGLCAIHCATTPLILTAISSVENGAENWAWLDFVFLSLSVLAVYHSTKHSALREIRWGLWTAWVVFAMGILLENWSAWMTALSYVGSMSLIVLHILNIRHFRRCEHCEP